MKNTKQWLHAAKQLCAELGPEDGVDPRNSVRASDIKSKDYKNRQLCKQAARMLSLVFAGELGDPMLQNLDVVNVLTKKDSPFLYVSISCSNTISKQEENLILNRLQAIQGYLRCVIAGSVKRKQAPALAFKFVRTNNEENCDAYSKNN